MNRWQISGFRPLLTLGLLALTVWQTVAWTVNRISVPPGQSLLLRYKGPLLLGRGQSPRPGYLARRDPLEVGVMEQLLGPAGISTARFGGSGPWSMTFSSSRVNWPW
jgi:hypothetical protein